MLHFVRRSLLFQLLSVYLLFVVVVLIGGLGVNAVVEQRLQKDAQASDQALAQEIAVETNLHLLDAENSLVALSKLTAKANTHVAMESIFQAFLAARSDVDHLYFLDTLGAISVSCPQLSDKCQDSLVAEFSPPDVIQRAIATKRHPHPVFEVGAVVEPSFNAGVIIAEPVDDSSGKFVGIIATNFSLAQLSAPLEAVVQAQQDHGRHLMISLIDDRGELIATPDSGRILLTVLDELPGADEALHGTVGTLRGPGPGGQDCLFSSVPVPAAHWAVVVQRPAAEALAVVNQFHLWLLAAALLFAIGGLLFWLILLGRVIRPLHTLAIEHQALPASQQSIPVHATVLSGRDDEVGDLARSLVRLELDGLEKLGELRTLLETSNAVVGSLDPHSVVGKIMREVRRLVDVQAAAVLLPDEQGVLRVLASDGHSKHYDHSLSLSPENVSSAAVLALSSGKPVQKLLTPEQPVPSFSYDEGFRSVLGIPIISRHAGGVVLLVHRTEPHPFNQNEIDLLLTFANYATLAWEHAVLYERSDERLRVVAQENERLYQQASEEKQKLEAIMGSMSDVTRERELDEFKTTLLAAVGHELRTPLAAIKGHASTLLQKDVTWSRADQHHFLQTISSEADRLAQLVSNLLDLSRQEAGLLLLNRGLARVQDLVAKTIKRLSHPGVMISFHIPDDLPLINVDGARIEVVLHNLVANALVYGEGEVRITAGRKDDGVVVSVSDNGPGIAPDELPPVFERFYRARHGRQQHSGGTGLGLAICKALIEAHGGVIWVESSMRGTTIVFSLPLVSPAVAAVPADTV